MSVIAKSLKKIKNNKKPNFSVSSSKRKSINIFGHITFIYVIAIVLSFVIVLSYVFVSLNKVTRQTKSWIKFPPTYKLENELRVEKDIALNVTMQPNGFEKLLILKKFYKLFELAKKENNLKYEGIYYFEMGNLDTAYDMLNGYLKTHPLDKEAKTYLAFVLYREKKYSKSLNTLNSINGKNCNVKVDSAIVNEAIGNINLALSLYEAAYKECRNPILKSRMEKKIIVLEYYLRNKNES